MEEIKYIPYGTDEIDYNQFVQRSADEVSDYVNSQPWSSKRKQSFLNAYQDLMSRGITGAVSTNGVWNINHSGDPIDLNSLSKRDQEMYHEAAYFIRNQMSQTPTKSAMLQKQEEEQAKLPIFDNEYFKSKFNTHISNQYFGGQPWSTQKNWNELDPRGENGLRGTTVRAAKLADALDSYSETLEDGKINFKESPFKDLTDLKTRLANASAALRDNDPTNDKEALNAIGLSYDDYFYNGANDEFNKGNYTGTYQDYYDNYLPSLEKQKQEEAQAKLKAEQEAKVKAAKAAKANQYSHLKFFGFNYNGKSLQDLSKYPDIIEQLNSYKGGIPTPEQKSELVGAFKNAEKHNLLVDLSPEEKSKFGRFPNLIGRLKKIEGLKGYYWDTVGRRIVEPSMEKSESNGNKFNDLVKNSANADAIAKKGWTSADTADVISIIGDLVSLGGFWCNVGGTVTSLTADLFADISRKKSVGEILEGIGANVGWGLAGLLPFGKSSKLVRKTANLIPKAIMLYNAAGTTLNPEVQKSAMKFTTVEGLKTVTSKDLENLKYLFHAVTGTTNIAKSHARATKYRNEINKQAVKASDNSTVKLTTKQVKEINKVGRKKGQTAAQEKFKEISGGKEAAKGSFNFNTKSKINPTRYSSKLAKVFSGDEKLKGEKITDTEAVSQILAKDKELPWYNWNKGFATYELAPFKNVPPLRKNSSETSNTSINTESTNTPTFTDKDLRIEKMVQNALNPPQYKLKLKRQSKVIKNGQTYEAILNDGNKYTFGFKDNVLTISGNKKNITKQVSSSLEVKKLVADFINKNNKINVTKNLTPEFINSIRKLKRYGFLYKQGGTLDKTINDFFINNIL